MKYKIEVEKIINSGEKCYKIVGFVLPTRNQLTQRLINVERYVIQEGPKSVARIVIMTPGGATCYDMGDIITPYQYEMIEKKFNESMGIYRVEIIRVGLLKRTWSGCKTMSADLTCGDAEFRCNEGIPEHKHNIDLPIFIDEMQVSGENGGIQSLDSTPRSE